MTLESQLRDPTLKPADRDRMLAAVWAQLKGTPQEEALHLLLKSIHRPAFTTILSPSAGPESRAFHSGVVYACEQLMTTLKIAINVDPTSISDESDEPQDDSFIPKEEPVY